MDRPKHDVAAVLKELGSASASELAESLGISRQAARMQLEAMVAEGLVDVAPERAGTPGRPTKRYALNRSGEHLFPKGYADLAVLVLDAVAERHGPEELHRVLSRLSDAKVAAWEHRLEGLALPERLEALRGIYVQDDPWITVESDARGTKLVERNCPFLDVAMRRPALCGLTVSTLSRLLGRRVVREERFQSGHGRCVFRVLDDAPTAQGYQPEDAEPA